MTAGEFLTNISSILSVMAIGALLETAVPMFLATALETGSARGKPGPDGAVLSLQLAAGIARGDGGADAASGRPARSIRLAVVG
jgi:hypothetical protein